MKTKGDALYPVHEFSPRIFTNYHEKKKGLEG